MNCFNRLCHDTQPASIMPWNHTRQSAAVAGKRAALASSPALAFIILIMIRGGVARTGPDRLFSVVCCLLAQSVCIDRENVHTTDVSSFPFFFSFAGLRRTPEGGNLMMCEISIHDMEHSFCLRVSL